MLDQSPPSARWRAIILTALVGEAHGDIDQFVAMLLTLAGDFAGHLRPHRIPVQPP